MERNSIKDENVYEISLNGLFPGKYSYLALARDVTNNTNILYDQSFTFDIIPNRNDYNNYIILFILFPIMGLAVIFIFLLCRKFEIKVVKEREWELTAIKIRKKERIDKLRKKKKLN